MSKFLAAAAAFLLLTSCAPGASSEWTRFQTRFVERYFEQAPTFAASQGRHEFDGRLPDWGEDGVAAQIEFLRTSIQEAEGFTRLNDQQRYERDYLVAVARGDLFWLDTADQPHTNPAFYMGPLSPSMYVARPYAAPDVRLRAYIRYLRAIPNAAQQIRANLRTPLPLTFIDYGVRSFGGLATYYQGDGKTAFASVNDTALQAELTSASTAAATAMSELSAWVEAQRPNA